MTHDADIMVRDPPEPHASPPLERFRMLLGGDWAEAAAGEVFESWNPYTGEPWALIPRGRAADADRAVHAAHAAFTCGRWPTLTPSARGLLLYRLADLIERDAERLAQIEVRDNGKLMVEMLAELRYLPWWFRYYGGLADKVEGAVTPIDKSNMLHYVTHEPLGVVAAITPSNSPLLLGAWKLAPALAAGNTIVVKPSEYASASTLAFAELFDEAGFPPGVVNVVTGFGPEAGEPLVNHPLVACIAFTGGEAGGRSVYEAAARGLKPATLELGGKSPNIVFADADLDSAVRGVIAGIFAAGGQTCMAGSRLLVEASIHDAFVEKLMGLIRTARLGDPRDPGTNIGPVATEIQLRKVLRAIEAAREEGAVCVLGGGRATGAEVERGWFVEPTIFTGVTNHMRIAREEVFGPVLSVIRFETEEEAIALANDSPYGLAAGVWTSSLARAATLPKRLQAGTVWVNAYRVVSYLAPFGGMKQSGLGRENGLGAIMEYLQTKSVFVSHAPMTSDPFTLR